MSSRGRRIDDRLDFRDRIGGEAAFSCMLANELFVGRDVDAVNLDIGDVAVDPLNLRAELAKNAAGRLGYRLQLLRRHLAGTGDFAFDDVLGHENSPGCLRDPRFYRRTKDRDNHRDRSFGLHSEGSFLRWAGKCACSHTSIAYT